ncbi:MAG: hypothetical protein QOF04_367, partial [Solirubrobacteraceae bacterium]|nr:hypothetical protein [Solirubrobacteraceae bacterium]
MLRSLHVMTKAERTVNLIAV